MLLIRANTITGSGFDLIKAWTIKLIPMAKRSTETVFTSQMSVLGPVTAIKLSMSINAHKAVSVV